MPKSQPRAPLLQAAGITEASVYEEGDADAMDGRATRPEDRQELFLPVWGFVWFFPEEVEVIDHLAFQRLRGVYQLGQAHIVYPGATHRRFEHCLGAVHVVQRMVNAVRRNSAKARRRVTTSQARFVVGKALNQYEAMFTRLGTLLHDIGHVPCGHTLEDELQLISRHDEDARLNKVFSFKGDGSGAMTLESLINRLYEPYVPQTLRGKLTPTELVRLLIRKQPESEVQGRTGGEDKWMEKDRLAVSCKEFRLQMCRDLIGNTICADLLDYIYRDWYHIGKPKQIDERLLQYMQVRTPLAKQSPLAMTNPVNENISATPEDKFVVSVGDRPKIRTDAVSEILNLLESRYQLAESVLFHRTKVAASAMLERALYELWKNERPEVIEDALLALSDDYLLPFCREKANANATAPASSPQEEERKNAGLAARQVLSDLVERRLFAELHTCFYDEKPGDFWNRVENMYCAGRTGAENRWKALMALEGDFGLERGQLAMYCPSRKMNAKIPEVNIYCNDDVLPFDQYEQRYDKALSEGHLEAQQKRFRRLWRIHFFISEGAKRKLSEKGLLTDLISACNYLVLGDVPVSANPVDVVLGFAHRLSSPGMPFAGREVVSAAELGARANPEVAAGSYPTQIPSVRTCLRERKD